MRDIKNYLNSIYNIIKFANDIKFEDRKKGLKDYKKKKITEGLFLYVGKDIYLVDEENSEIEKVGEKLDLMERKIKDVKFLSGLELSGVKELLLSSNEIEDVGPVSKMIAEDLMVLALSDNKIEDISNLKLKGEKFEKLELVNLSNNKIEDISVLSEWEVPALNYINLGGNIINSLEVILGLKWEGLERVSLNDNALESVGRIFMSGLKLKFLDLKGNEIENKDKLKKSLKKRFKDMQVKM